MTDEPEDPPMSAKPVPAYRIKKARNKNTGKRNGVSKPGPIARQAAITRQLRELNIHVPVGSLRSQKNVANMKQLKSFMRETWATMCEQMDDFKRFSVKQINFARFYAKQGRTNKTLAAKRAGYDSNNDDVILKIANSNLRAPYMEELISAFEFEEKVRMKITVEEVVTWFNKIAMAAMDSGDYANANRAMENLGKYLGMFIERKEITHKAVHNREELDARIVELTRVLKDSESEIEKKLGIAVY
jgi:hypothetical protein